MRVAIITVLPESGYNQVNSVHVNTITLKGKMNITVNRNTHRLKICALCMFFKSLVCHLLVWLCNNNDSLF